MTIEKITGRNAGTINAAGYYLESRNIIADDVWTSGNGKRVLFFKGGEKIAEYREDLETLKIYHRD